MRLIRTGLWVPACLLGWGLPALAIALRDYGIVRGVAGDIASIGGMLFGGVILGLVTGRTLVSLLRPRRAAAAGSRASGQWNP